MSRVLITGSEGLIGTALARLLAELDVEVLRFDLRARGGGNVRRPEEVRRAIAGASGVVHLAAVSRVVWAERAPALCRATNVVATRLVLAEALAAKHRPWVIFASSREVYGRAAHLPVREDAPLAPINLYGASKLEGERMVDEARASGLRAAVVRLSNAYGSPSDHADRVVPAFARAAVAGDPLRVDGGSHTFDFTHVRDVARGLVRVAELLASGERPPPVHLVTGVATTLRMLACTAIALARSSSPIVRAAPRAYDVEHFAGDPGRAASILGWRAEIPLDRGLFALMQELVGRERGANESPGWGSLPAASAARSEPPASEGGPGPPGLGPGSARAGEAAAAHGPARLGTRGLVGRDLDDAA